MEEVGSVALDRDFIVQVSQWGPLANILPSAEKVVSVAACAIVLKQYASVRIAALLQPGPPGTVDPSAVAHGLERARARAAGVSPLLLSALEHCCPVQTLIEGVRTMGSGAEKVAAWKAIVTNAIARLVVAQYILGTAYAITAVKQTFVMGQLARAETTTPEGNSRTGEGNNSSPGMLMAILSQLGKPLVPSPEDDGILSLDGLLQSIPRLCDVARGFVVSTMDDPSCEGQFGLQEYVSSPQLVWVIEQSRLALEAALSLPHEIITFDVGTQSTPVLRDICATQSFHDIVLAVVDELWINSGAPLVKRCVADSSSFDSESESAIMVHCAVTLAVSFAHSVERWLDVPYTPLEEFCQLLVTPRE